MAFDESLLRLFRKRQTVIFFVLVFLSVVMLLLSTRSLTGVPERIGLGVSGFFEGVGHGVGKFVGGTANSIAELQSLRADYNEAVQELSRYQNLERTYAEIRQENNTLKDQLGFLNDPAYKKIAAEIIAKDPGNLYSTIVINQGSAHGVQKDMPVIAYQNGVQGLVGRILEVSSHSSIVLPVYDQDNFVAARLEESRYEGLVEGQGRVDQPLLMQYVNKASSTAVKYGDLVSTSGLNGIYPKGLAIGRVTRLLDHNYKSSLDFEVESVVDFSRLEYVFVIAEIPPTSVEEPSPSPQASGLEPTPTPSPAEAQ